MNLFKRPTEPAENAATDQVRQLRASVHRTHLRVAYEDYLVMAARVEPTPTYEAVTADLGFDPRVDLT